MSSSYKMEQLLASLPMQVIAIILPLLAAGCSDNGSLLFVSKTSLALEAGSKPPAATLGFDRFEGYLAPKPIGMQGPSALATFESTGNWFNPKVCQVYALGATADQIAGMRPAPPTPYGLPSGNRSAIASISSTTVGLKIGYTTAVIDSLTLGYKRLEASYAYLPNTDKEPPSVLMVDGFGFGNQHSQPGALGETYSLAQSFAQGTAAFAMANGTNLDAVHTYLSKFCP